VSSLISVRVLPQTELEFKTDCLCCLLFTMLTIMILPNDECRSGTG